MDSVAVEVPQVNSDLIFGLIGEKEYVVQAQPVLPGDVAETMSVLIPVLVKRDGPVAPPLSAT